MPDKSIDQLALTSQIIRQKLDRQDLIYSILSFLLLFIPLFAFFQWQGIKIVGDAISYIAEANQVIKKLSAGKSLYDIAQDLNPFYLVCIYFLALIKYLGGDNWPTAILIANAFFYSLCAPCVYLIYRLCGGYRGPVGYVGAALLPLAYPDALFLGNIPLRDIPFTGGAAAAWLIIIWLAQKHPRIVYFLFALFICLLLALYRPNSIIFTCATIFLFIFIWWSHSRPWTQKARVLLATHLFLGVSLMAMAAYWFSEPFKLPTPLIQNLFNSIKALNNSGMIIIDHADLVVATPEKFWDYLHLLFLKSIYYFRYWNPMQSSTHIIYRHIYFGLLFANTIYFAWQFLRGRQLNDNQTTRNLIFFTLNLALAGALLHSILVLAFEFRYQMIIFPGIWALFLINGSKLIIWLGQFRRQTKNSKHVFTNTS